MNKNSHQRRLLHDVLAEQTGSEFRQALLQETLGYVRRRRRFRQARNSGAVIVALALLAFLVLRVVPPSTVPQSSPSNYQLVRTHSLPEASIVHTRPLQPAKIIASSPTRNVVSTTSDVASRIRQISDDELLALAGDRAAVLVRHSPQSAELIFPGPKREGTVQ